MTKIIALVALLADCHLYDKKSECAPECKRACRQAVTRGGEVLGWYCPEDKDMPPTRALVE